MTENCAAERKPLTRDRIVAVALEIVDAEGTAAVTMRRVASQLGVRAPSLYEHVRNRAEILLEVHAAVLREIGPMPATGDWRADLRGHFLRTREVFLRHGDVAALQFGAIPAGPDPITSLRRSVAALVASGLAERLAWPLVERLSLYTTADAYEQWEFAHNRNDLGTSETVRLIRGEAPDLAAPMGTEDHGRKSEQAFRFGLDLMLAGAAELMREGAE